VPWVSFKFVHVNILAFPRFCAVTLVITVNLCVVFLFYFSPKGNKFSRIRSQTLENINKCSAKKWNNLYFSKNTKREKAKFGWISYYVKSQFPHHSQKCLHEFFTIFIFFYKEKVCTEWSDRSYNIKIFDKLYTLVLQLMVFCTWWYFIVAYEMKSIYNCI